jgi:hypothetical protein
MMICFPFNPVRVVLGPVEPFGFGITVECARLQLPARKNGQMLDTSLAHALDVEWLRRILIAGPDIERGPTEQTALLRSLEDLALDVETLLFLFDQLNDLIVGLPIAPFAATIQRRDVYDLPRQP